MPVRYVDVKVVARQKPAPRPPTAKQKRARAVFSKKMKAAGIQKGMSKRQLFIKMKCAVPKQFGKTVAKGCDKAAGKEYDRKKRRR